MRGATMQTVGSHPVSIAASLPLPPPWLTGALDSACPQVLKYLMGCPGRIVEAVRLLGDTPMEALLERLK
jgi:hypothetical protein